MSMYDLAVPTTVYDKQIQQLTSQIATIEDNDDLVSVTSQTTSKFQVVRGIFYLIGIYCTAIKPSSLAKCPIRSLSSTPWRI